MGSKTLFKINNVGFSYSLGSQKICALKNLSLEIPEGNLVTFSGPSGSGKSTLLNLLGLIDEVQEGEIHFLGEKFQKLSTRKKNRLRKKKIGFIFQSFHLVPVLTAEENVAYFLKRQKLSRKEVKKRTREALEIVGLWEHRKKKPLQLSGGQRQRVAIARALAKKPDVVIGDEITASLDQKTGREIMDILSKLVKNKKITVILTTHDSMVQSYSNLNFHIQDGELIETTREAS